MQPTEILKSEHRVIETVLSCLEKLAGQAREEGKLDKDAAEQAIDFIKMFADGCHHGKEEAHLFTAMANKGVPEQGGPIGQMVHEHEQGRAFVRNMAENIPAAAQGDSNALDTFTANARGYVELLRAHIKKEDHVLFVLADRVLDEDAQRELLKTFEIVETEHMGEGTHKKYLDIARSLAARFDVPAEHLDHAGCSCGH